ncbi:helix-turn-helix transcriptional regulator [Streptomyces sp. NPDC094049]|uniref:helix-turn-helix domain-containing protein n=1 Tax=Streptomyces sp. NPDC094049 TaxID=3154987 RepID=UPI003333915D
MSSPSLPRYRLVNPTLFRMLMQRTGTGAQLTLRDLGDLVGIPHTTIGNVLAGDQESVSSETAQAIATTIGVDLLILWVPVERAAKMQPAAVVRELVAA